MFSQVINRFGTLDILVNNAAALRKTPQAAKARLAHMKRSHIKNRTSLEVTKNISDDEWNWMIAGTLNSVFYCTREALHIMEKKKYGKIINIASVAGISGLSPHSPDYSAAKGGVVAFTKAVAAEVAPAGVIVNAIAAGGIATPEFLTLISKFGEGALRGMPLQRLGTIEEYASLVVYLASDEAGYIIGQVISPNGGIFI